MRHEITIEDMIYALDTEISVASSCSARKKSKKSISFNPSNLKYTVTYKGKGGAMVGNRYLDPLIAMSMYNERD